MLAELRDAIEERRTVIIGPIRQEILSGIKDKALFTKTRDLLDPFRDEETMAGDYVEAARMFNLCRQRGVQCGPVDILICAVATRHRYGILTFDQSLNRCIEVLQSEGLLS